MRASNMVQHAPLGTRDIMFHVEEYVQGVLTDLMTRTPEHLVTMSEDPTTEVFELLTSRRYCHLGRKKSSPYRPNVVAHLKNDVHRQAPMQFYFDLGPGYHASLDPSTSGLCFDVGLGELLAIRQVVAFCNDVRRIYTQGARFWIVIDNLCGWATNDIPLSHSRDYVRQLRALISSVGADDLIDVLVESENATEAEYAAVLGNIPEQPGLAFVTRDAIDNVARFLGRPCSSAEASFRIERYRRTSIATETLLARAIQGVRLTQRASATTLGFRPFAGGDQRIQVGQAVFSRASSGHVKPILLSSRNVADFDLIELSSREFRGWPPVGITYAHAKAVA